MASSLEVQKILFLPQWLARNQCPTFLKGKPRAPFAIYTIGGRHVYALRIAARSAFRDALHTTNAPCVKTAKATPHLSRTDIPNTRIL